MELVKSYLCPKCRSWLLKGSFCVSCKGYWVILDPKYKENPNNYRMVTPEWEDLLMDIYNIEEDK